MKNTMISGILLLIAGFFSYNALSQRNYNFNVIDYVIIISFLGLLVFNVINLIQLVLLHRLKNQKHGEVDYEVNP